VGVDANRAVYDCEGDFSLIPDILNRFFSEVDFEATNFVTLAAQIFKHE